MVKCIQALHKLGYIHRDIKPANFLIRSSKSHPICLVDFGLAQRYIDPKTKEIRPMKQGKHFIGTRKYGALNAHEGYTLSRRDDMMSCFYSVIELFVGELPWSESKDNDTLYILKKEAKPADLCSSLPPQFIEIYRRIRVMKYEEEPPYDTILSLIQSAIDKMCQQPFKFDWEFFSDERVRQISAVELNKPNNNTSSSTYSIMTTESGLTSSNDSESDSDTEDLLDTKDDICMILR